MPENECTIICLDNSEWMRNGDYSRTRFEAQHEGAHTVLGLKTRNPESTVGVITMAGGANVGIQVLCSPTDEKIKVMRAFANAKVGGKADFATGLQVAQLALKFKKSHFKARIVVFVGSPIEVEEKKLTKIAKGLRKNNISIDIISMGETDTNMSLLEKFIETVNKGDTSHLVVVPPGTYPEDAINASPLGGGNQFAEYGGVDPELDPELAAAMQESLMLAQAQNGGGDSGAGAAGAGASGQQSGANDESKAENDPDEDDEEAKMLAEAMEMSMLQEAQQNKEAKQQQKKPSSTEMLDPDFLKGLVESVAVDVDNEDIQNILNPDEKKDKKDDEQKDEKK